MQISSCDSSSIEGTRCWGGLPDRLHALFVAAGDLTGSWLADALSADSATRIHLEEAFSASAAMLRMREESFDVVLVTHAPPGLDALEFAEALRSAGCEEPLVVLSASSEPDLNALAYEAGADAYLCATIATTRTLLWQVSRAVERHHLIRENRRLSQAQRHQLRLEHQAADRLLDEQRSLVRELERLAQPPRGETLLDSSTGETIAQQAASESLGVLPTALTELYRELLRAYVIMGSGNLAESMSHLAEALVNSGVSARQTMQLHLCVLEDLVRGLGNRSARHVMTRADLLVLEVMVHLCEGYRRRWEYRENPPRQLALPGFDKLPPAAFAGVREG